MKRFHHLLFTFSLLGICWLAMQVIHELGHVFGAIATGGTVQRVTLHPMMISQTEVSPNPMPGVVVWLGPIIGSLLPLAIARAVPSKLVTLSNCARFLAGFCLLANGCYIALGSFSRIGDCGEMLRTGSPHWVLLVFGAATITLGLWQWHRLGSIADYARNDSAHTPRHAYIAFGILATAVLVELAFSVG